MKGIRYMCKKAQDYLEKLYRSVEYPSKWMHISVGDDKYIWGAMSPKGKENMVTKAVKYRTLFRTVLDLDWKIKISFDNALIYGTSDEVKEKFQPMRPPCHDEKISIYYMENALLRVSILWDILAQLYNLICGLKMDPKKLDCGKVFSKDNLTKLKDAGEEKETAFLKICEYLAQKDDVECDNPWKGNHKYVKEMRNQLTHRQSPNLSSASNFGFVMRDCPLFIAKRLIEDYVQVSTYISEIMKIIETEVFKEEESCQP